MNASQHIAERFRAVMLNGELVAGTNFKKVLSDISWQEAESKIASLNSIAALTFHVHYYITGVLNVLQGGELTIHDKYSYDCPILTNEKEWAERMNKLFEDANRFAETTEQLSENKLQEIFVQAKYGSYQQNLELMIEHCYYHLGQIVLIKKLIRPTVKE